MKRACLLALCSLMVLAGCSSRPEIPVSDRQTLVMETSVMAAGVIAEKPELSSQSGKLFATSTLYNEKDVPVTLNYQFYWYEESGLELHPLDKSATVIIPAHSRTVLNAASPFLGASQVRLYLWL
ncbi:YcfL family protein [Enterobacter sp. Colony194]|uniref:YcfL family protein n=1 Tax=Enterobacter sp. Colony194 TaxID=2866201 RepID=UPI001C69A5D4|nr:YcfL family protein [Enterobacter sp. Colony194]